MLARKIECDMMLANEDIMENTMNKTLEILACLYYEVHSRFYKMTENDYCDAMHEVSVIADSLGYTINDLAKVVIYAE